MDVTVQGLRSYAAGTPEAFLKIKYPAVSNGVFALRGRRQISAQVRLLGSLLEGIKD